MKLRFTITPNEGDPYQVTTNLAITVAWERKYKRRVSQAAHEGLSTEELLFMAYEAAKRSGITVPLTLDSFIDTVDEYEIESVTAGPTSPASTEGN